MEKPHKKLDVWNMAIDLTLGIYHVSESFPKEERFGLTNQMRRAALSVPSNIAEGAARQTRKEFMNYLHMAQGSLSELDTHLEPAKRLDYLAREEWTKFDQHLDRIDKMLSGLIRHQKTKNVKRVEVRS
ncbi:MAG: hypothetical protein OJF52_003690 [Nitrospira sp.]|jgi:four helix bundle protein|nr:MAG: hypothetical protein OJF52_003690 [Nitrospira sp.]